MKRKGFTLVELLAVIVILAVISLITIPMILGVIETAKKGAAEASANNYMESLNQQIMLSEMNETKIKANEIYNITKGTEINGVYYVSLNEYVNVKGSKPTGSDDYITLNEKYEIVDGVLTIDGYEIKVENGKIVTIEKGEIIELESIELNSYSETMERGTSYTITTTFNPTNASDQRLTYESSNTDIVEVDEKGLVTAKTNGEAKITVTPKGNKDLKKEITITVISPSEVTGITLNTSEEIIGVGETYSLIATLEPMDATSNSLTWTSSNESIAIVSDAGIITGLSVGEATISAETQSGLKAEMRVTVKYTVTLNEEKIYTTEETVTFENIDTTSYTNISCNNGGVPTISTNNVTVSNITGNTLCNLNTTIAAINNMDNTKNTILMINDEIVNETVIVGENQNIELDINGTQITAILANEVDFITNNGILSIKDTVGTGLMKSNYRLLASTNEMVIESGQYEGSTVVKITKGTTTLKNSTFVGDLHTAEASICEFNVNNCDINSEHVALLLDNPNCVTNVVNSNLTSTGANVATVYNLSDGGITNLKNSNVTHMYNEVGTWRQAAVRNNLSGIINIDGGEYTSYASEVIYNNNGGTINIKSGTFYSDSKYDDFVYVIRNNGKALNEEGTINICGGIILAGESIIYDITNNNSTYGAIKYKSTGINWINGTEPSTGNVARSILDDTITCES